MYENFPDFNLNSLITFNSGSPDAFGSYWYLDGPMAGWDSPDGRVTMLTKIGTGPTADGEIPADEHYRGRTISFKLTCSSSSEIARENSRLLLAQALDLVGTTGTLTVNENVPKVVAISRSGNSNQGKLVMTEQGFSTQPVSTPDFPTATPESSTGLVYIMETDVEVYCADPRKYAVTPVVESGVSSSGFTFTNPGNTDTSKIVFTLPSAAAGDLVIANGSGMIFGIPITPGPALPGFPSQLVIDAYLQSITDGSGNNYYYLRQLLNTPPWPTFSPGSNTVDVTGMGGSFSFTYYPAWI